MAPLRALLQVLTAVALSCSVHASLRDTLDRVKAAHNDAAAAARLKHIQALTDVPNRVLLAADDDDTSFQVYTTSPSDAPAACQTALVATVACNSTILDFGDDEDFAADELDLMCTDACSHALNSYRAGVASACGTYVITDSSDGSLYPPTTAADAILASYNTACERDASGAYCASIFDSFGPVPPGDQGVLAWPSADICTPCTMGALNITVSNPFTYTSDAWNALQSALKTCGSAFAAYNVTHPPASSVPTSPPLGSNTTSSAVCALTGRSVTVQANSTCAELGAQFGITAFDVLQNNPVLSNANCTDGVLPGVTLCVPRACTLFSPSGTQTCDDVVKAVNAGALAGKGQTITSVQLTTWNANLVYPCLTLTLLDASAPICITPHGGFPSVAADPDSNGGNPVATPTATAPPPGETAPGTTAQCGQWAFAGNGTNCYQLLLNSGVTFDEFRILNPEIDENCFNLWAGYWYCIVPYPPLDGYAAGPTITDGQASVTLFTSLAFPPLPTTTTAPYQIPGPAYDAPPSNLAPGTISAGCSFYHNVTAADASGSCTSLASAWGEDPVLFYFYNNNTAAPCPQLVVGTSVCLMVLNTTAAAEGMGPPNRMAGSGPFGCTEWHTIVLGDDCGKVATEFGLSPADFFVLNPELATDCTNLVLDAAYCVSPPPAAAIPTTTAPSGPTTTTSSGPTPTQTIAAGSWTNCTTYYQVQSGESCPIIETKFAISQSDFLLWNPEIKADCANLDVQRYCVAGSPAACGKTYTVASGDFCSLVESKNGIDDATLHRLNPWLDANCDMQVGQVLCVAPPSSTPKNIAPGSWTNCTTYYQVVANDNCNKIETTFGLSFTDLLKWNSGIDTACDNLTLNSYCVAGSPQSCAKTYTVVSGDFCSLAESKNGIDDATLHRLNPWLDANCDMQIGQNLCVAAAGGAAPPSTPTNIAPGSWTNCTSYYQVVSGDNCNKIEAANGISFTDLLKWNTGISKACDNLALDSYCVAATPKACGKTYTVVSGDFCSLVESKNSISDATLHTLNPWLDANCGASSQPVCSQLSSVTSSRPPNRPTSMRCGSLSKLKLPGE
ncbi:hypothetical protein EXIGLDRAFT_747489 [Exidia glandulosa HHB12029]|uniref:LysM domain-containing protein n=1 Tax=Exidia glandulosa HHB12029 TaxID=1314781 RepID=A0A165KQD5_EXIGL|nr:hypothetical protein EXIGLDRAFT_747489 [Exidia glandulosa HHB12029]